MRIKSIDIKIDDFFPADFCSIRRHIISDVNPMRKCGVSGYWIESFWWYGERIYLAVIDACWLTETIKTFYNLRDASDFICEKMRKKKVEA